MLENSSEYNVAGQDLSSYSFSENAINDEPEMNTAKDNCNVVESAYRSILDELIDDAILDVCFEVHRSTKLGHLFTEKDFSNFDWKFRDRAQTDWSRFLLDRTYNWFREYQGKEQLNPSIRCISCGNLKGTQNFTKHLSTCMRISDRRKASQKITSFKELDIESEDDDSGSEEFMPGSKKKSKKSNRNARKQPRLQGNSDYQHMTHEEKRAFFNENCGVILKRTKKLCTRKVISCSHHTDEQRKEVRIDLLKDRTDQIANEEEIDVDTVDEDMLCQQYTMPS